MTQTSDFLTLIPARGGSKGVPRKNLRSLAGKPLLQYTLDAALGSRYLKNFLLSSEDSEILTYGKSQGLQSNYVRPMVLAQDTTGMVDVALDAVDWWEKTHDTLPKYLVLLQPTSPFRTAQDIDQGIEVLLNSNRQSLVAVTQVADHPYKVLHRKTDFWTYLAKPDKPILRRQDYGTEYVTINGALYIVSCDFLRSKKLLVEEGSTALFEMSRDKSVDIDTWIDWYSAEAIINAGLHKTK